ncbi:MAG TPA: T9SS type A sorting domain-containing protein [candidate division WOR-3 bacterium]|uniref:T9SS type A sorting domain-containing protein n=1 Tax=candidate division WOR-3 bacterium TaxID=2052148 RepID=A0A7V0XF62_UNCW3|nr:T9SS type A sorting domain-containing protein [candidate division WOR-3 bacterium]
MPWQQHPRWSRRAPKDGARGVSDESGGLYVLQGNRSLAFWRYDIGADGWEILPDVPAGPAGRPVVGGSDLVHVRVDDEAHVYLLKGRTGEFYRYDIAAGEWQELPAAPVGIKGRWDRGSWLVHDGMGTIYAHKARYTRSMPEPHHELWLFDVRAGSWEQAARSGLPLIGWHGNRRRAKRSRDGSGAGWFDGAIWSLKGGNSQQYFRYDPGRNRWHEEEPIDSPGSANRRRMVKDGGHFVAYPRGRAFYALKGNKTVEFWRYRLAPEGWTPGGGQSVAGQLAEERFSVGPNPVRGASVRLNWNLAAERSVRTSVFDAAGRLVKRLELGSARGGNARLDISGLAVGTYLVRLDGSHAPTQKLVVQR